MSTPPLTLQEPLLLEGTLRIIKFRGPGRRPQLSGYEASTVGVKPVSCTEPTVGFVLCNIVGIK